MRIIAGKWRGRSLAQPSLTITRPTTDRVREALFSILTSRISSFNGMRILDAFAGSGALGLEALSRGAEHVTFAEKDANARRILIQNIATLACANSIDVFKDVFHLPHDGRVFDLVFMDPPYGAGLETMLVSFLVEHRYINVRTTIVLETQSDLVPQTLGSLTYVDSRVYGNCALSFWVR